MAKRRKIDAIEDADIYCDTLLLVSEICKRTGKYNHAQKHTIGQTTYIFASNLFINVIDALEEYETEQKIRMYGFAKRNFKQLRAQLKIGNQIGVLSDGDKAYLDILMETVAGHIYRLLRALKDKGKELQHDEAKSSSEKAQ